MLASAIVFDLDGTLVDSEPTHERLYQEAARRCGWDLGPKEYDELLRGKTDTEIFKLIKANSACTESVRVLVARKQSQYREFLLSGRVVAVEGAPDYVTAVVRKGLLVAVATSATREEALLSLGAIGLGSTVRVIVTAEDVSRGKPNPDIYLAASERLGVPSAACLAYEDSVSGVMAACSAGMHVIGVSSRNRQALKDAGAHDVIASFAGCKP